MQTTGSPDGFYVKPKKSRGIKLFLLATAVVSVGAYIVYSQNDEVIEPPQEYTSVSDCIAQTSDTVMCEDSFKTAKENYLATTQPFSKIEECEAQFGAGKCATATDPTKPVDPAASPQQTQQTSSGGGFFVPMMAGIFLSRMMSGGGGSVSSPFYRNAQGDTFAGRCDNGQCNRSSSNYAGTSSGGGRTAYSSGFVNSWTSNKGSSAASASRFGRTSSISRGGFGSGFHSSAGG